MKKLSTEEKLIKAIFGDEEVPPLQCSKCRRELGMTLFGTKESLITRIAYPTVE